MLFNSIEFLLFLPLVFAAYWILNRWTGTRTGLQAQNLLRLTAVLGGGFFRAESLTHAAHVFGQMAGGPWRVPPPL